MWLCAKLNQDFVLGRDSKGECIDFISDSHLVRSTPFQYVVSLLFWWQRDTAILSLEDSWQSAVRLFAGSASLVWFVLPNNMPQLFKQQSERNCPDSLLLTTRRELRKLYNAFASSSECSRWLINVLHCQDALSLLFWTSHTVIYDRGKLTQGYLQKLFTREGN